MFQSCFRAPGFTFAASGFGFGGRPWSRGLLLGRLDPPDRVEPCSGGNRAERFGAQVSPHGGLRPFHQKSTCLTLLTFGVIWCKLGWSSGGDPGRGAFFSADLTLRIESGPPPERSDFSPLAPLLVLRAVDGLNQHHLPCHLDRARNWCSRSDRDGSGWQLPGFGQHAGVPCSYETAPPPQDH